MGSASSAAAGIPRRRATNLFRSSKATGKDAESSQPSLASSATIKGLRTRVVSVIRRDSRDGLGAAGGKRADSPTPSPSPNTRRTDSRSSVVGSLKDVKSREAAASNGSTDIAVAAVDDPRATPEAPDAYGRVASDGSQPESKDKGALVSGEGTTLQRKRDAEDGDRSSSTSAAPATTEDSTVSSSTLPHSESPEQGSQSLSASKAGQTQPTLVSAPTPAPATASVAPAPAPEKKPQHVVTSTRKPDESHSKDRTNPDQDQDSFMQLQDSFVQLQIPRPGVLVEDAKTDSDATTPVPGSLAGKNPFNHPGEIRTSSGNSHTKSVSFARDVQEISPSEYSAVDSSVFLIPQPTGLDLSERDLSYTADTAFASTSYVAFDTAPVSYEWFEHVLPDTSYYYTLEAERSPTRTAVTTDADMRLPQVRRRVEAYLRTVDLPKLNILPAEGTFRPDEMPMPEPGPGPAYTVWKALQKDPNQQHHQLAGVNGGNIEVYLQQIDSGKSAVQEDVQLATVYVRHGVRVASMSLEVEESSDAERLEHEMSYWGFIELHPAHVDLSMSTAPQEAMEALTWSYSDRLMIPTFTGPAGSPFTEQECQELLSLLRELTATGSPKASVILTRIVAKVHLRLAQWRHQVVHRSCSGNGSAYSPTGPVDFAVDFDDASQPSKSTRIQLPFKRTLTRIFLTFVCLGVPYLMHAAARRNSRYGDDELDIFRSAATSTVMMMNAAVCLTGAVMASISVTFLVVPGLEQIARILAIASLLFSLASLAASLLVLPRKPSSPASTIHSLPAVFLAYSVCSFIAAIAMYAVKGTFEHNPQVIVHTFPDATSTFVFGLGAVLILVLGGAAWTLARRDRTRSYIPRMPRSLGVPRGYRALPS